VDGPLTDTFRSSPALADLDRDGKTDVLIGTGFVMQRGRIDAISGSTRQALWTQDLGAEAYSTPIAIDLTGDRVDDVIAGGRMNDLRAYDGQPANSCTRSVKSSRILLAAHLNTPVVVDDADSDGIS
jgi:hypothetical protein